MIEQFVNSGFFLPAVIISSLIAGGLIWHKILDARDEDQMEEEALSEVVRGDIEDMIGMFGNEVKKEIQYGMSTVGRVEKAFHTTELPDKYLEDDKPEGEEDELAGSGTVEDLEEYYYFKIRPDGFFGRLTAKITDDAMNGEGLTNYVRIRDEYVEDGEVISIAPAWNPTKMAGTWLQEGEPATAFVREKTYKKMFTDSMETAKESIRAVNQMNLSFVESAMEMEKLKEMKSGNFKEQMEDFLEGN